MIPLKSKPNPVRYFACVGAIVLTAAPQMASAMEIRLALMGQAGVEDPRFDVLVNGAVVGGGTVLLSAKSANGEYLTNGTEYFDPYIQRYVFKVDVPEGDTALVGVRFLNDYFDGDKGIDANLYIVSASVDGKELDLAKVSVAGAGDEPREPIFWRGVLMLPWYATATLAYPDDVVAAATDKEPVAEETVPAAAETATTETTTVSEPEAVPVEVPVPACAAARSLSIVYANGEAALPAEGRAALDELISSGLAGCTVTVAGYSSPGGPDEVNRAVAEARASEVAAYLRQKGPEGLALRAEGKGATSQFGAGAANRRVVVSVE